MLIINGRKKFLRVRATQHWPQLVGKGGCSPKTGGARVCVGWWNTRYRLSRRKRMEVIGKNLKSTKEWTGKEGLERHYDSMWKKENSHPMHLRRVELGPTRVCGNEGRFGSHPGKNFWTPQSVQLKGLLYRKKSRASLPIWRGSVMTTHQSFLKGPSSQGDNVTGHLQIHTLFEHLWPCDSSWDGKCMACMLCPPLSYPWQTSLSNTSSFWRCSWYLFPRNCQQSILFCIFR